MSMEWNEFDLAGIKNRLLETLVELQDKRKALKWAYQQNERFYEKVATLEKAVGVATEEAAKLKEYIRKLEAELADLKKGGLNHD